MADKIWAHKVEPARTCSASGHVELEGKQYYRRQMGHIPCQLKRVHLDESGGLSAAKQRYSYVLQRPRVGKKSVLCLRVPAPGCGGTWCHDVRRYIQQSVPVA